LRHVGARVGSKCEELNLSKSGPQYPTKPTSIRGVTTSLMGQQATLHAWFDMKEAAN
jgi:hypothetical protein